MNCADLDILLCDYVDGTLDAAGVARVEAHLAACSDCAELARDARAGAGFVALADAVEPPPALITKILYNTPHAGAAPERPSRSRSWWQRLFEPVLQPRFAMGMAMTILSFSMVLKFAGVQERGVTAADLDPVRIWASIDSKAHRAYDRVMKYYENMRLVYSIQDRLREWSAEEEDQRARPRLEPIEPERGAEQESAR